MDAKEISVMQNDSRRRTVAVNNIRPITNISAAQTMKFAVSGGVTDVVDSTPFAQAHQENEPPLPA